MKPSARLRRLALHVLLILIGLVLCSLWALRQGEHRALLDESRQTRDQLDLYASSLTTLIERYRALPAVLALDPELRSALQGPISGPLQQQLNRKLEQINQAAHSSTLELLDRNGLAVAASNWRLPLSYVGNYYDFRPYFAQARTQGSGSFYAVGVTTGIPGYFLSQAVQDDQGGFLGAAVVKLEFPGLEQGWSQRQDVILVSDDKGVVFIANHDGWRYRTLRPLSAQALAEQAASRQYDRQPLPPLRYQPLQRLGEHSQLVRVQGPDGEHPYLWESLPLANDGWTLHLLQRPQSANARARNAALAAGGAWLALVFSGLFVQQRWRLARLRQRSQADLERLVEERTAALRTAQDSLVQAAKLAALGQMSAALAHEINQPLTAQRMQLASLRLLLAQNRQAEALQVSAQLDQLLERMAALTGHLKTFARKSPGGLRERLDLAQVVDQALQLLEPRLRSDAVDLQLTLARPAWVRGDAIRLEQVLVNLLRNALDATRGKARREIRVRLDAEPGQWHLSVGDNGGGIAAEHLSQVFDPFFTTKSVGDGLGLGLAVSYGIVLDQDGRLEVHNRDGGALFSLYLPIALDEESQ